LVPTQRNSQDRYWIQILTQATQEYIALSQGTEWELQKAVAYAYDKLEARLRSGENVQSPLTDHVVAFDGAVIRP
jgi:hypothetical protein